MDKILTRKLFKDVYLKSLGKEVSNFNKGGLASLRIHHFDEGGSASSLGIDPTILNKLMQEYGAPYTEGQQQAMLLAPIASALLTGTRMPGQSELGAVASNVGAALPQVTATSMAMKKLEDERLAAIAKASTVNLGQGTVRTLTPQELIDNKYQPGDIVRAKFDPLRPDRITQIVEKNLQSERLEKIQKRIDETKDAKILSALDNIEELIQPYVKDGKVVSDGIPGLGPIGSIDIINKITNNQKAKDISSAVQGLANIELKERSGTAVTNNEMQRFKSEYTTNKLNTAQDYVNAISRIRKAINTDLAGSLAGSGALPEDLNTYIKAGGTEIKSPLNERMSPTMNYVPGATLYRIDPTRKDKLNIAR